ncbi:MAG: M20 family metallo-hydrolase [Rikenellaceae bacterium]
MDAEKYIDLLKKLISTPSISRQEQDTAQVLYDFFVSLGIENVERLQNNVFARNKYFDPTKPSVLLNSHHDTVKPNASYTRDPFKAELENGKLYGLGSNDAGASGVSLLAAFMHFYERKDLKYNLIIAITAEEEISGLNGLEAVLPELGELKFAIVGEPTHMQMAIAERGLLVLDCTAHGVAGHAARNEGDNAIYKAIKDIEWIQNYKFPKVSDLFGDVKMTVSIIGAGTQHNVVPDKCTFTVDVRVTDKYTNQEVVDIVSEHLQSEVKPRSLRLRPSSISPEHEIVKAGLELGLTTYGSPTTSDQVKLIGVDSVKIGVGDSARSHSADEYVYIEEIENGIEIYIALLEKVL